MHLRLQSRFKAFCGSIVFSISRQALGCQHAFSKPCLINFISKHTHLVFSISLQASRCQQAFSKSCLVNLISKDIHLVLLINNIINFEKYQQMTNNFPTCQELMVKPFKMETNILVKLRGLCSQTGIVHLS